MRKGVPRAADPKLLAIAREALRNLAALDGLRRLRDDARDAAKFAEKTESVLEIAGRLHDELDSDGLRVPPELRRRVRAGIRLFTRVHVALRGLGTKANAMVVGIEVDGAALGASDKGKAGRPAALGTVIVRALFAHRPNLTIEEILAVDADVELSFLPQMRRRDEARRLLKQERERQA